MEWQPIDTAPKKGFFLVCSPSRNDMDYECSVSVAWHGDEGELISYLTKDNEELPYIDGPATHWMPLPEPPAGGSDD